MNEEIEKLLHREQLQLATVAKRSLAFFIDELLLSALFIIIVWDSFSQAASYEALIALTNSYVLEYMAIKIIYQTFFVSMYGASIGKIILKIRVIEAQTLQKPRPFVAFNRAVFRIISELLFYLGFLWGALSPTKQAWHDLSAKTLVVDA